MEPEAEETSRPSLPQVQQREVGGAHKTANTYLLSFSLFVLCAVMLAFTLSLVQDELCPLKQGQCQSLLPARTVSFR